MFLRVLILTSCPRGRSFHRLSGGFPETSWESWYIRGKPCTRENTIDMWSSFNASLCFIIREKANNGFPTAPMRPTIRSEISEGKLSTNVSSRCCPASIVACWVKQKQSKKILKCLKFVRPDCLYLSGQNMSLPNKWPAYRQKLFAGLTVWQIGPT